MLCRAIILFLGLFLSVGSAQANLVWHWDEPFSADERARLRVWLEETHGALERYAGPLPFPVHVHLHRRDGSEEPVPWANTWRDRRQSIYFYVDPRFPQQAFLDDWTAAHELAHLLLPYLGGDNAWFAEGFASYLQHSIMVEMGVIDREEALRRRDEKMRRATAALAVERRPLPQSMVSLRARGRYPTFYWGGAVYFERVDLRLQEQGSSLQRVLRKYVGCCRSGRRDLDELVRLLDRLGETQIFSQELVTMRETPGCPERIVVS